MIELSDEGAKIFSKMTAENINKNLTIVLDGEAYSSPKIMSKIDGGKCVISGNFTKDEAKDLAALIQYGELPLKFRIRITSYNVCYTKLLRKIRWRLRLSNLV